jgi:hypothetical protein
MDLPKFKSDDEMGEWFEANDVEANDLPPADDVVISDQLVVTVLSASEIFLLDSALVSSAATVKSDRNRDLTPVA